MVVAGPPSIGIAGMSQRRPWRRGTHGLGPMERRRRLWVVSETADGRRPSAGGLARSLRELGAPSGSGVRSARAATRQRSARVRRNRAAQLCWVTKIGGGGGGTSVLGRSGRRSGSRRSRQHGPLRRLYRLYRTACRIPSESLPSVSRGKVPTSMTEKAVESQCNICILATNLGPIFLV